MLSSCFTLRTVVLLGGTTLGNTIFNEHITLQDIEPVACITIRLKYTRSGTTTIKIPSFAGTILLGTNFIS